ncbi:hypothetical protein ABVT39_009068 [Epinephelus coioides]
MVKLDIQKAKDRYIARELALLRASKPTPPMVSHLDEVDDAAIEEGVRRVIEAASHAAATTSPIECHFYFLRLVEEFRGHTEGANPSKKTSENAKQRAKHVRDFLEYMADSSIPNVGLLFLSNHARIRGGGPSRGHTPVMAISTYAAKTRKRREKHKKDNIVTIASSEDEREYNKPAQNEDNQGFEEEEQEPLGQEKRVRKRLNQLYSNKILVPSDQQIVSSSDEDDAGDMKTTLTETVPDPDEEHVPKRTYQLREKRASVPLNQQMTVTSFKEDGTDKREVEFPFQKRENFSSSEGYTCIDEPISRPKTEYSPGFTESCHSQDTCNTAGFCKPRNSKDFDKSLNKNCVDRVNMVNKMIFHQSSLFEVIMPMFGIMGKYDKVK